MIKGKIELSKLNLKEGIRYLGYGNNLPGEDILNIIKEAEKDILKKALPRFTYKVFDIEFLNEGVQLLGTSLILKGESIKELLLGCKKAVLLCVTLSNEIDKLINQAKIRDMTKAVIIDAFSSVAVEQASELAEKIIKKDFENEFFTMRYGFGYGDLPIDHEKEVLNILNSQKTIGVTVTNSFIMTPRKTTAVVVGISDNEIKGMKRGCISCNLKESCKFRIRGERCGY